MADDKEGIESFGTGGLDPSTWVDPKQEFPGIVEVSEYRWASEKYVRGLAKYRPGLLDGVPEDQYGKLIPQWYCRVVQLDAVFESTADKARTPAHPKFYGFDMKKWNSKEHKLVDLSARYRKEWDIATHWKEVFGQMEPPSELVGKKATFDFYAVKNYGGNMPSTNVLFPTAILDPEYEFTGDVRVIPWTPKDEDEEAATIAADNATAPTAALPAGEANAQLAKLLDGVKRDTAVLGAIIPTLPATLKTPAILTGLATGTIVDQLIGEDLVTVNGDGIIRAS